MLTKEQVETLADHWVAAWNAHDLDGIMSHYEEDVVLISPVVARLLGNPAGTITGKPALRAYFQKGLEAYPNLTFDLIDIMWGLNSVVLYYVNQNGGKTGEFMEIGASGKVAKVVANYNSG